jgi:hypothetical protein
MNVTSPSMARPVCGFGVAESCDGLIALLRGSN